MSATPLSDEFDVSEEEFDRRWSAATPAEIVAAPRSPHVGVAITTTQTVVFRSGVALDRGQRPVVEPHPDFRIAELAV